MASLDTVDRDIYLVRGDTECHRQGDGYERSLIVSGWDESDVRRIARVKIRVDRFRANSYANVDVWVPATGWNYITSAPQEEWWDKMPGYTRSQTLASNRETLNLVDDLVERLIEITHQGQF
jgi:hypothetical protein